MKHLNKILGICLLAFAITSCKQQPDTFKQLSALEGKMAHANPGGHHAGSVGNLQRHIV
jgi:hypothetical protein